MSMHQQTITANWDAIIIGAGVAGLTTAAFLATNGKRVLVLEQHSVLGGCSHVFRRKNQWEFDVGIHYIGDCGVDGQVPKMFRGLGLEDRVVFEQMDVNGFDTIVFPDLTFKVPVGWDNYLSNLIKAFPKEEKSLRRLVGILSDIGFAIDRSRTPASTMGMVKFAVKAKTSARWALLPMSKLLDSCNLSPKARAVLSIQFGLYGCPPSRAPVAVHAGLLHNYVHGGAYFPRGGGQVFAGHLHNVIINHGGLALTSASVQKILLEQGKVVGVRLASGEEFRAPVVVSAADLKKTYLNMIGVENLPSGLVRKVNNYQISAPFLNVYMGVDLDLSKYIPNSNFFVLPTEISVEDIHDRLVENAHELSRDQWLKTFNLQAPAYVHCGSLKDPTNPHHAPVGCSSLEAMTLVPAHRKLWTDAAAGEKYSRDPAYLDMKAALTETMIERVEFLIPQVKGKILWKEASTPLTQGRYTDSSDSTAYGLEVNYKQFGPFRPRSHTKIAGLFIAGTSTTWGPSIEGSMLSGMHAASAILGRDLDTEMRAGRIYGDPSKITSGGEGWDPLKATSNLNKKARAVDINIGDQISA